MTGGEREGIMGEKGEGFTGTILKDIWTITTGVEMGEGGREEDRGGVGGKDRKLHLNNK